MPISLKTNGPSFRAAMETQAANLKIGGERRIIRFARTLHGLLVDATPKLTGKASAEWQISLDSKPVGELLPTLRPPSVVDYQAYAAAAEQNLDGFTTGQTIYITNNAPYITALNAGSSYKAPAMFVEFCEAEALAQLKATVRS